MKYMMILNTPRNGYQQYMSWPKEILAANGAFMESFTAQLAAAGELVGAEGLASPEEALRVRAGEDGEVITDGVFPESKEFLSGYWIIDVASHERALEVAAKASQAPGLPIQAADGSKVDCLWIELRRIMSGRG
jgi:hypothetical protein